MGETALSNQTYEAYLALEAESEVKYEFHDGFISAMAGGTPEHGLIAMNFSTGLNSEIQRNNKPCAVYSSDVKMRIEHTNRTFYPDASVVCDKAEKSTKDPQALTNPVLILEVLSESTAAFDRGAKFAHYRQIESLREYVLVSQNEPMVDTYYRTDDGTWEIQTITNITDKVVLKSLDCEIPMSDIYRMVPGISEA